VRARLTVPAGLTGGELEKLVLSDGKVQGHLEGKTVARVVTVPGRLVNIAVRQG
jgi:leucyl-tRNA synthetase